MSNEDIDKRVKPENYDVSRLFSSEFIFKIPPFQRPFSWKADNFDTLFEDIFSSFEVGEEEYFLGPILLQKEDKKIYSIIDGQQRLMSLSILLAVLRDKTPSKTVKESTEKSLYEMGDRLKGIPSSPRIEIWEDLKTKKVDEYIFYPSSNGKNTRQFLKEVENGTLRYKDKKDPIYSIYTAINIFTQKYDTYLKGIKDDKFLEYLYQKVYFVGIVTYNLPYAIKLFDVLNTRGLPLTPGDILKAINLAEVRENKRDMYAKIWRNIEENIGRENVEKVIEFIRTLLLKTKAKKGIIDEYEKEIFKNKLLSKGENFFEFFKEIGEIYLYTVLEPDNLAVSNYYKNLVALMRDYILFDDWIPPLIEYYRRFELQGIEEFLNLLERKTVIEWVVGYTPSKRITSLNTVIKWIDEATSSREVIDRIQKDILSKLPNNMGGEQPLEESEWLIFKRAINGTDFYNEKYSKYILLRIDLSMADQENFNGYSGMITIEHILPQTPPDDSQWVKNFSKEERDKWTNAIGNLVLLGRRKNASAKNYNFDEKKIKYFFKKGMTPFRITQEIKDMSAWTPDVVEERQKRMVKKVMELYFGE